MAGAQSTYVHTLKCLRQDLNSGALSKELTYDTVRIKKIAVYGAVADVRDN